MKILTFLEIQYSYLDKYLKCQIVNSILTPCAVFATKFGVSDILFSKIHAFIPYYGQNTHLLCFHNFLLISISTFLLHNVFLYPFSDIKQARICGHSLMFHESDVGRCCGEATPAQLQPTNKRESRRLWLRGEEESTEQHR